ncbi:hypothetical protein KG091_08190 [Carnobacteriaceae bacterium zg-ZUI78]|uniref:endolytic transglycosylase MltG n=1 Tax=Granulicatella sp. zg-84 TaxID=2678503 RepID=UPI0013BFC736|nr:endolytic transglycosylase MltG [Granulicatella sp. zg-84]MBS4751058.1 hypothetical protein [Carnobacteriaceae bacterium zg-ZUI78]NEW65438.1 hypothetical protein [Granulicatella sp. zg-84]QMI85234.1 hypothetical protein H1220_05775 [Carnobacteriaceae bacterium zg-84]
MKQAFRFLGIGFLLSGLLLFGLQYAGMLTASTKPTPVGTSQMTTTATMSTSSQMTSTTSSSTTQQSQVSTTTTTSSSTSTSAATSGSDVEFIVKEDDTSHDIAENLKKAGLIDNADDFIKYLYEKNLSTIIQTGKFKISKGLSFEKLSDILTTYPGN